jgi:hypothetical protein
MTLIGLDLNASRARAVRVAATTALGVAAAPLLLEDTGSALPLALHLERRPATVGSYALARARQEPHLVCQNFLPYLGQARQWVGGANRLDACGALRRAFEEMSLRFGETTGVTAVVPEYLTLQQVNLMAGLTQRRWKLLGSVPVCLAATLAVAQQLPWSGTVLVIDVDDHALSCAAVVLTPDRVARLAARSAPTLSAPVWIRKLLDGTAQRCIRLSRRDPRDSAEADQSLYLQLTRLIEKPPVDDDFLSLALNTPQWSQHLMMRPTELMSFCLPLVQQALLLIKQVHDVILAAPQAGPLAGVVLTPLAAGLPGLLPALERSLATPPAPVYTPQDLGAGLLQEAVFPPGVHILQPDDLARSVLGLGSLFRAGRIAPGFRDTAPVPRPFLDDAGPPRLHFQGHDYELGLGVFSIGRDSGCTLVFPSEQYPHVSAHHCDVLLDQRHYTLRDHSRHGTLVNDRPVRQYLSLHSGDRIRLGPQGPVLQFFGRS